MMWWILVLVLAALPLAGKKPGRRFRAWLYENYWTRL
jgi:hypothetical protein